MASSEGGCLCSAVRYRVSGPPLYSVICHCTSCRRAAGSPSVAWITVQRANFQLIKGAPRTLYSSPGVLRTFCEQCGTPLTYENDRSAGTVDITTASMDDPTLFPPNREIWVEHRISWQALNGQLEHYPQGGI